MAFDLNSAKPLTETELEDYNKKSNEEKIKNIGDKILGTSRALTQGASFGQASHLSGITNELANLPKKVYGAKSINDLIGLYKDTGKDYTKGREQFKTEYKDFEDKNKALAFGGDLIGGLATGGMGTKVITNIPKLASILNSTKLLQSPAVKSALVGSAFGGGYGASNTLGKGFDFKNSLLGAGAGAVLGGGLGKITSLGNNAVKRLLGGKEKALLEKGKPIQQLENQEIKLLDNTKEIPENVIDVTQAKVETPNMPKNIADVAETKIEASNLPQKAEQDLQPITRKEKILNSLKTGYQMDGIPLITPNGMQYKNMRAFMNNPKFWKAASEGSLGRKWETLQNEAADEFRKMNKEIKSFVKDAYKDIPDNTFIPLKYNERNQSAIELAQEEISKLANKKVTRNQASAIKKAQDLLDMARATITEENGNPSMSFGNIKDMTQQLHDYGEFFAKKDNRDASNMFKAMHKVFTDYRDTNPLAKKATERYRDFKSINKTLDEIGADVEKVSNNNNLETRIQVNSRGRAGEKWNRALDKVLAVLDKYPELKQFKGLKDKSQLAQIAYDARPASNDKLLDATSFVSKALKTMVHPVQAIDKIGKREAQDELQVLGRRLLGRKIKPEDFKNVDMFRGGDSVNVSYYRNKAYGNILDELKSKKANKEEIENLFKAYQGAI